MAIVRNELINDGEPYAVLMKGGKRRKYQHMDKKNKGEDNYG